MQRHMNASFLSRFLKKQLFLDPRLVCFGCHISFAHLEPSTYHASNPTSQNAESQENNEVGCRLFVGLAGPE